MLKAQAVLVRECIRFLEACLGTVKGRDGEAQHNSVRGLALLHGTQHSPCKRDPESVLPTWLLPPLLQVTNPLYLWQLWRADARYARHCFARHNAMMDDKVAALLKLPPPDYTIAGTWHPASHMVGAGWHCV